MMSNIEILQELKDRELLKPLVIAGIIPAKVLVYAEMYYHVDAQVKTGKKKTDAVYCTAIEFNVYESNVWRALKSFK